MNLAENYKNIDKLTQIARGFMKSEVLLVANELKVFSVIGDEGKTLEDICSECNIAPRGAEILLNALTGMDLLTKKHSIYENSFQAKEYLVKGKKCYQGDIFNHLYRVKKSWSSLLDIVRSGDLPEKKKLKKSEEDTRHFIMGMSNVAYMSAEKLLSLLDLSNVNTLLDLGGGPASYSITFCKKYPSIKGTVLDLPEVIPITLEEIEKYGMEDRIDTIKGSFLEADYEGPYDCVFISNIIHMLGEKDIRLMFKKSFDALNKGGKIIVKDFFVNEDRSGPEYSVLFAVNMLAATQNGNTYTESELIDWLTESGFLDIEFKELTPQSKVVIAIKI